MPEALRSLSTAWIFLCFWTASSSCLWAQVTTPLPSTPAEAPVIKSPADDAVLKPLYLWPASNRVVRLVTENRLRYDQIDPVLVKAAFRAVLTQEWPAGFVPIFAVEKKGQFELRRLPVEGKENFSEPLFFALPPQDEPEAALLAGRWESEALRESGSREYVPWELAIEKEVVAGRFDQNTQYRFAYITGGAFRSNRLELRVEYIMDHYLIEGALQNGKFSGTWKHLEGAENGTWEASRAGPAPSMDAGALPLYEWRHTIHPERRYHLAGENPGPGWIQSERPLCRVWPLSARSP